MTSSTVTSFTRYRSRYIPLIDQAWQRMSTESATSFLAITGAGGSGKLDTFRAFAEAQHLPHQVFYTNGSQLANGYFAGFYPLFMYMMAACEAEYPEIIARHEQSIKRLFPFIPSASYQVPADLTNLALQEERTRFYHHEFQEKLLHGIYEFFIDYCEHSREQFVLVIDNADQLSPTIQMLLRIMSYRQEWQEAIRIVLLFDGDMNYELQRHCEQVHIEPLDHAEAEEILAAHHIPAVPARVLDEMLYIASGNTAGLLLLTECMNDSLPVFNYLTLDTYTDFYLSRKGQAFRYALLKQYIQQDGVDDHPAAVRNYAISQVELKDQLHRQRIREMEQQPMEERIMHPVHYVSLSSEVEQLTLLAPVAIKLQEIGVYNTWFDLFSCYFISADLRMLPDGDELHNAVFVRMSFILYSLGIAKMSIPYLEFFYENFPESKLIPMILYSQSMTYGRYQVPVQLDKAEHFAMMNLEKIDSMFKDHPKHVYVKVFAENALAYIRAKQGRFDEAIELCTAGIHKMKDIYGEEKYALHQSILVYNTGQIYEILKDFDKAYEMYNHAIRLDPYYGEYYNDMANLLQNHGRLEQALDYYQRAIDLCPPYYEAHMNRAGVYEKLGQSEQAYQDYLRVIELKPDTAHAYSQLSTLCYQEQRYDEAEEWINQAIYYQAGEALFYNNKGLILQEQQRHDEAKQCFEEAVRRNPRLSEAYSNAAVLAFEQEQYEQSLTLINQAIELDADPDYRINRGIVYRALQDTEQALAEFEYARQHKQADDYVDQLIRETTSVS